MNKVKIIIFLTIFSIMFFYSSVFARMEYIVFPTDIVEVTASSELSPARDSVDGNEESRWESKHKEDFQWIMYKFKEPKKIKELIINWEKASAKKYNIEVSKDGKNWKRVLSIKDGLENETRIIKIKPVKTQYLRIYMISRTTEWGYSIWEIKFNPSFLSKYKLEYSNGYVSSDGINSNGIEALFDDKKHTLWESKKDDKSPWVILEMGKKKKVSAIVIKWKDMSKKYKIEYSINKKNWNTLKIIDSSKNKYKLIVNEKKRVMKYIRIICLESSANQKCSIYDVNLY